ncbi:MAG: hypothetical protein AUH78_03045 [Gemmatimonadetes bacterium 13_1_40CM_4_69_8]|nr:MAG: hypothetical protein AUH78_03045 [Gemmatimonadetes bacterium 13_1_40CM_4_69_8]
MASLKRWVFVALAACVALALAYLPPRGAKSSDRPFFLAQSPRGTPARQRAQAVADEWRAADGSLRLLGAREHFRAVAPNAWAGTSLVVVSESAGVWTAAPRIADSAIHVAWEQLRLGETKVRVAVILQLAAGSQGRDRPLPEEGRAAYLTPDSTDRTTCIAVVSAGSYWTRILTGDERAPRRVSFAALVQSLKAGLGPCAFYAAYGTPGKSVRSWLASRGWDLALTLDAGQRGQQWSSVIEMADRRYPWFWEAVYSLPSSAVGCLAGRPDGCGAAVLAGASDDPAVPFPDILRIDRRWGRVPRLVEGQRFLGDVARAVGRDRFLSFWTSPLSVDTALAAALKHPVGEWTADWQSDFVRPIRLGPVPPLGAVAIALLIAALAVAVVAITASRRQVR